VLSNAKIYYPSQVLKKHFDK